MPTLNIWRNSPGLRLGLALGSGLALLIGLLLVMGIACLPDVALAQGPTIRYVDGASGSDSGDCKNSSAPCATVQYAVDVADPGDEIRVATGTYSDVQARPRDDIVATGVVTQVVYISKTVTLRGGYTAAFTDSPDPVANPTMLDAQGQGRVLYITGNISPTIENLHITGGNAAGLGSGEGGPHCGGGIYIITAATTISNNQVFSNTIVGGGAKPGSGLYILNSSGVLLSHNTIGRNKVEGIGGGLHIINSPDAMLVANTISENCGVAGGGAFFGNSHRATLIGNTITDNEAQGTGNVDIGGGIYVQSSDDMILVNNTIRGNWGKDRGGGLYLKQCNNIKLADNIVTDNWSYGRGGGLYLDNSDLTLTNNVIADNQAGVAGSGLYILDSSPRLLHTTIARNSDGDASGVHIAGTLSSIAMTNTILVSHSVGITVAASNTATLNGVLWDSNTANTGGEGTIIVTNAYTGDPAFAADGYHLTPDSAALDRGMDAGIIVDIDGEPRPFGAGYDLGADEGQPALTVTKHVHPDPAPAGGHLLTYTIWITNTDYTTLTATITDVLPDHVTPTGFLTWTPTTVVPGGVWTQQFVVTLDTDYTGPLTNVVQVTTEEGATGIYTQTSTVVHLTYLPVVLREG